MAPEIQAVVRTTQTWLQSSWHIQVPFAWLNACVEWLQDEAGGAGHLSQQQINQQALDQWLLTDLRDLDYPVLPEGIAQAQKTELNGTFCVQVDSLLDISQPAYGQLQKWRGTDSTNDEVSAVTQATQRTWEARPTRMLLLQVTDGVQNLEAMEYQPIPALSTALRPGAKLQLQGKMVCRLGVLLLGSSNVRVLGGEVEDLVDRNNLGRMLCRTLGLPEEQQQEGEEVPPAPQQVNQEVDDLELDDAELLASLEAQEVVARVQVGPGQDSGYRTVSETSTQSSRSSSVRSLISAASSRSEASSGFTQNSRDGSVQRHYHRNEPDQIQQDVQDHNMEDNDFPDEDFDDLPLDELDSVIYQENTNVITQSDSSHISTSGPNTRITGKPYNLDRIQPTLNASGSCSNSRSTTQQRDDQGSTRGVKAQSAKAMSTPFFSPAASEPSHEFVTRDESDFMDEDMDCFIEELDMCAVQTRSPGVLDLLPVQQGPSRDRESATNKPSVSSYRLNSEPSRSETKSSHSTPQQPSSSTHTRESYSKVPTVTLTSPPFTYLCLLDELMSEPRTHPTEICVKAFIVTLLGKLSSSNGIWRVRATISDGTGYLDVELSDQVLSGLLGFSVAEKGVLKRDPARRGELEAGMKRCQEELVDMCCVMTVVIEPEGRKAVVSKADPVNEKVLQELEQRVRDRRK